ncbi:hypothetical protein E2C01_099979 [Portunus trituberculatus]|uniref:Uncharacterized protein n=1 Tax=Portunus trituberculatus TaxID=210409 RepID=A0A5B7KAV8_PORTR|nr:hypothetical protein [Portunus trituberculatus]
MHMPVFTRLHIPTPTRATPTPPPRHARPCAPFRLDTSLLHPPDSHHLTTRPYTIHTNPSQSLLSQLPCVAWALSAATPHYPTPQ